MIASTCSDRQRPAKLKTCATLKSVRERNRITRVVLAQETGLSTGDIKSFEDGVEVPWKDARSRLCDYFGLTERQLFPELSRRDLNAAYYEPAPNPPCLTLKDARRSKGWTQFQLASFCAVVAVPGKDVSGLDATQLSKFEIGARQPWPVAIVRLCVVLDQSIEQLFPELIERGGKLPEDLVDLVEAARKLNGPVIAAMLRAAPAKAI